MTESPLISVIMPVYNARRYLAEAIGSILSQTVEDFEFIIIDDGSTDGSSELLREFAATDRRIRLVSRPNTGYCVALGEALGLARGTFVARMDADDISLPHRFERQIAFLAAHPDFVAVGSRVLLIDPDGRALVEMGDKFSHEEIDDAHLRAQTGSVITHPAVMMRREALNAIGGYRAEFEPAEDLDLFLRLAEVGRLANLPEVLLKYRQHPASVGHTRRDQQIRQAQRAAAEACVRRGLRSDAKRDAEAGAIRENVCSPSSDYRRWAWWALRAGHLNTARKYAFASVRRSPFTAESWRLMYCSLRGH